jgi:EmrB/QacA subfamily drug resistance transporter
MSPDPRRWWILAVLCCSLLVISIDNTILNAALPGLQKDLGATASQLQWIVDGYMLVFAGLLLTAGSLGDRFGRRRALTFGLVVFGAGSALSAISPDASALIASRALMGVGAAFIMPSTLSILTNVFPPSERGRAIGAWTAVAGLGIAIGPLSGGWLIEHWNWSAVFLVNLPIVVAALAFGRVLIPESRDPAAPTLDVRGFALSSAGLVALVWAIIEAPARGWTSPAIVLAGFAALALLAGFAAWERRAPAPMLDLSLFRNPRFSAASATVTLGFFALFGSIFFLTQYLQAVLGYDAFAAGLRVMPIAAGLIMAGPLSAKLAGRVGTKFVVAAGMGFLAAGLSLITATTTESGFGLIAGYELAIGFGIGMAMAPATESIMGALPLEKASIGSAINDAARTAGGALGVAILGSVVSSIYRGSVDSAVSGLGEPAAESARGSLAGALSVAQGDAGGAVAEAARQAFVNGMHGAALVAAAIALAGAVVALVALPARERQSARLPIGRAVVPDGA